MNLSLVDQFGEYALMALFLLFFISIFRQGGFIFGSRISTFLGVLMLLAMISSNWWPIIKTTYICFFALIALVGKFGGSLRVVLRSRMESEQLRFRLFQLVKPLVTFAMVIVLEFSDTIIAPFIQRNVPAIWWLAGAWLLPAIGIAQELVDPSRTTINSMFPAGNRRMMLFLFVLAAGLLTPLYVPHLDLYMRLAAVVGGTLGLILSILSLRQS